MPACYSTGVCLGTVLWDEFVMALQVGLSRNGQSYIELRASLASRGLGGRAASLGKEGMLRKTNHRVG